MSYLRPKTPLNTPFPQKLYTPIHQPLPGRAADMIPTASGSAMAFKDDDFTLLRRFLILGIEGGTACASQQRLLQTSTEVLDRCFAAQPVQTLSVIREVSKSGSARKNDQAIFALARVFALLAKPGKYPELTRDAAMAAIREVCRTGTHFFMFVDFIDKMRGMGSGMRKALWSWYLDAAAKNKLDYQLAKYRNREGWTHRDVMRIVHPKVGRMSSPTSNLIAHVVGKEPAPVGSFLELVARGKAEATSGPAAVRLLREYPGAAWEMLPTEALNFPEVWDYLISEGMPPGALLRNLNRVTAMGLAEKRLPQIHSILNDPNLLSKARIHPLQVLLARKVYLTGKSIKGSSVWTPLVGMCDILEEMFYGTFKYLPSTGKRFSVGLDVSGSMGRTISPDYPISHAEVAGAMVMALVRSEPLVQVGGFCSQFRDLGLYRDDKLDTVLKKIYDSNFGSTDCAIPVTHAFVAKQQYDVFLVMTDGETNCGPAQNAEVLARYRKSFGPSKMIFAATEMNAHTLADPKDLLSLSIAGFDPSLPAIVQGFVEL